jgi:hypothetical protein
MWPHLRPWSLAWAGLLICLAGGAQARTVLTYEALMHGDQAEAVDLNAYLPDPESAAI